MSSVFHSHHPFRIFAVSGAISLLTLAFIYSTLGWGATLVTFILIMIEVTFSFDNAIINTRILSTMSLFWQRMFITVGMVIAVFGMRVVFPVLVVMITSGLPWNSVVDLALHQPHEYAHHLEQAHISIAAFGGLFLLMLSLHFFFDPSREVRWIHRIEKPMQDVGTWWLYSLICLAALTIVSLLPFNPQPIDTFIAGSVGILTYLGIHAMTWLFTRQYETHKKTSTVVKAGLAGLTAFIYLEVLDASFSFDGVIGAFAVTNDVVLIAAGLGIGALWVRSLTIFMVRRKVLNAYRYLEHGAHYTIGILAIMLLAGVFLDIPEAAAGGIGMIVIGLSVFSSIKAKKIDEPVIP